MLRSFTCCLTPTNVANGSFGCLKIFKVSRTGGTKSFGWCLAKKVFVSAIIANGHHPGSIWLQLVHQFCSLNHVAQKAVFEVKHMSMGMLHYGMTNMRMNAGLF